MIITKNSNKQAKILILGKNINLPNKNPNILPKIKFTLIRSVKVKGRIIILKNSMINKKKLIKKFLSSTRPVLFLLKKNKVTLNHKTKQNWIKNIKLKEIERKEK